MAPPPPPASTTTVLETPKEQLAHKYVLFTESKDAFDVQPAKLQSTGPSPYAFDSTKGPSVLGNYEPKRVSGALDKKYKYVEATPQIGREYIDADLVDVLADEELIRDLAITISERGVVFFRNQDKITSDQHKDLINKLGRAAGKPETSGLHIHPTALAGGLLKGERIDPEISLISSRLNDKLYTSHKLENELLRTATGLRTPWHSDVTFEPVPSDYTSLRIIETPSGTGTDAERRREGGGEIGGSGGDTLWASGYALAEKISPTLLQILEGLTGEYSQPGFKSATGRQDIPFYTAPRGAPENVGDELIAHHPIVRTNPTTGWKSIFGIGHHFNKIIGLNEQEAHVIQKYLLDTLLANPDIQVRFKWNANDIAIWDNRSAYHTAVPEKSIGVRTGLRAVSIGERPFLDPKSTTRTEGLQARQA